MDEIVVDGKVYKYIMVKKTKIKRKKINPWTLLNQFVERLKDVQDFLKNNNKTIKSQTNNSVQYLLFPYVWDDSLVDDINKNRIKPPDNFIDKIFTINIAKDDKMIQLTGRVKTKESGTYLKLDKNQIMILDALLRHGGYNKKYYDQKSTNVVRYSEHAGYFDIKGSIVRNIIVSGNTLRVDRVDEEIFLPLNRKESYTYHYIFHTHPPTPKPGGRVTEGVLYEFPSIGDILYFIDHHNRGNTNGSFVMTSEGLYCIRKLVHDRKKIKIDEDTLYNSYRKMFWKVQQKAIEEYGMNFNTYFFYSNISQNRKYIDMMNIFLEKYQIVIDFFPRSKDFRGSWMVDTIYVPIIV